MKVSYKWLKELLNFDISVENVADLLTNCGLEVEGVLKYQTVPGMLKGVVTGEVMSKEAHPNADKLSVTKVNIGTGPELTIICGAPNVEKGQKVAVATIGSKLFFNQNELKIKKTKIRGIESEGMICAEDELGIGDSHDGILVLPPDTPVGIPANNIFHLSEDSVFEIGLTPNRTDATSHIGVARDLKAVINRFKLMPQNIKLKIPPVSEFKVDNNNLHIPVNIENSKACSRYTGVTLTGIEVKESPAWLKDRLKSIGIRPLNNIVDITNFVLHETGQPLHAFDADKIEGKHIIVKTLHANTKFTTLDEKERTLTNNDLMICDKHKALCLAGVFGGLSSGVTKNTTSVFLESAYFDSVFVRKTSKHHGLKTDASFRFERGADPNITVYALKRAALLIKQLAGGLISSEIVDVYPKKIENRNISFSLNRLFAIAGKEIEKELVKQILEEIEIEIIEDHPEHLLLSVPPFKVDVTREIDVIEEVLRIYGYNYIEVPNTSKSIVQWKKTADPVKLRNVISDFLCSIGFNEMMSNSLTKLSYYDGNEDFPLDKTIKLLNPLSNELNGLRQTMLYSALEAVGFNHKRKNEQLLLFEFGKTYEKSNSTQKENLEYYIEKNKLSISLAFVKEEALWNVTQQKDFFFLKSVIQDILQKIGVRKENISITEEHPVFFEYALAYSIQGKKLGSVGMVKPQISQNFDVKSPVFYAELDFDVLFLARSFHEMKFATLPKFHPVERDLALMVDENINYQTLHDIAMKTQKKYLTNIRLFDVYQGGQIEKGKKSYALKFYLEPEEKPLADKEIDKIMQRLISAYKNEVNASLR